MLACLSALLFRTDCKSLWIYLRACGTTVGWEACPSSSSSISKTSSERRSRMEREWRTTFLISALTILLIVQVSDCWITYSWFHWSFGGYLIFGGLVDLGVYLILGGYFIFVTELLVTNIFSWICFMFHYKSIPSYLYCSQGARG